MSPPDEVPKNKPRRDTAILLAIVVGVPALMLVIALFSLL